MSIEGLYVAIGWRVRRFRQKAGISQNQLAKALGVTRASVCNIENGKQRIMLHHLNPLARALGVQIADLLPRTRRALTNGGGNGA